MRSRSDRGLRSTSRISSASWSRRSGKRLAHVDAGQRADAAVEALEVLDVDGRPDVDAGVRAAHPRRRSACASARAGGIRVRQLVDDRDARPALEQPLDVGLRLGAPACAVAHERRALEPARALLGRHPPVRLEIPDHEIGALLGRQARVPEHLVGLADPGGRAEVEAQESAQVRAGQPRCECRPRAVADPGDLHALHALFRRPASVLSGAFARTAVASGHGYLRRRLHARPLRGLRRLPPRDRAAVSTSQVIGLIVTIGLLRLLRRRARPSGALLMATAILLVVLLGTLLAAAALLAVHLQRVYEGRPGRALGWLRPVERSIYRAAARRPRARHALGSVRARRPRVLPRLGALPLRAPARSGRPAAESGGHAGRPPRPRVQHRRLVRDQHELAVLLARAHHELPHADARPGGAELRLRRRRHGRRRRGRARVLPLGEPGHRQLLGRPRARHALRARPDLARARRRPRRARRRADVRRPGARADARRRRPDDRTRPVRGPGGDQGARHERRRLVQRQLGASRSRTRRRSRTCSSSGRSC